MVLVLSHGGRSGDAVSAWCLAHPFMTFWLGFFLIEALSSIGQAWARGCSCGEDKVEPR